MVQIPEKARQWYLPKKEGIDSLAIRTFDVPKPEANQVLVKIHAASLNYRDIIVTKDEYSNFGGLADNLVPCSDGAGEVVAIGADVTKWAVGDRVIAQIAADYKGAGIRIEFLKKALGGSIDGTLTEYQVFPDYGLVKIPDYLSYEEASTLPCAAITAWNALHGPVPVKSGDYVLVLGTGGVSIFALQFAVAAGATVIATSSSNDKLEKVKKLGAQYVINYRETPDWEKEVLKITNGEGVHHVIEVGGAGTLSKSLSSLTKDGWIHVVGFLGGPEPKDDHDQPLALKILTRHANVRGAIIGPRLMLEDLARACDASKIKPVVDSVYSFDKAVDAYKYLASQKHVGKVVIRVANQ
ncbi:hypothetical protein EIP86_002573 [Pleurotus ostreatoroseus]|nr:hypothetical protein EIP86_002573 [Pleurotus ostreatoroseus]